jgi:SAM-dependent methyltransferase
MTRQRVPKQAALTPQEIAEDRHWWFASRTRALFAVMDRFVPGDSLDVLDVGCGAGNMIHHLSRYGTVKGIEIDPRPVRQAQARGYDVRQADAALGIPFDDASFDLVTVLDVIEHNEDDLSILRECHRVLRANGHLALTVPALPWLWSYNDVLNAHVRRYVTDELRRKVEQTGLRVRRLTYNNFLVFPLAAALILLRNRAGRRPDLSSHHFDEQAYQVEMEPSPPLVNSVLTGVGIVEAGLLRWMNLPIGTALICVAQKSQTAISNQSSAIARS